MDSVKPSSLNKNHKLAKTIAKVLNLRATGAIAGSAIAPAEAIPKPKRRSSLKSSRSNKAEFDEEKAAVEAILAKIFAGVSTVKSAYAQLQFAQSPYDSDSIQSADQVVVSELKNLSELKRCYLKKQFDPSPEIALVKAEIQEQRSLLKTYEITVKKLESQSMSKDSDLVFLREKLDGIDEQNKVSEKRLNQSGQLLSVLDNLHFTGLNPSHFVTVLRHAGRSIRGFVKIVTDEMRSAGWDFDAAARSIQPEAVFQRDEHKCFALESFVCREMFDGFCHPNFHSPNSHRPNREKFFVRFTELKPHRPRDYLVSKPRSTFASFCRIKYSKLVHPRMEFSFLGNLETRNLVHAGDFSSVEFTGLFAAFAEMAKRVWLLHCLAFAFEPEASIFQIRKGCRFSEVYMESIAEEVFPTLSSNEPESESESESIVGFTVVPGFRIGKTVIQSKVYLSQTTCR